MYIDLPVDCCSSVQQFSKWSWVQSPMTNNNSYHFVVLIKASERERTHLINQIKYPHHLFLIVLLYTCICIILYIIYNTLYSIILIHTYISEPVLYMIVSQHMKIMSKILHPSTTTTNYPHYWSRHSQKEFQPADKTDP